MTRQPSFIGPSNDDTGTRTSSKCISAKSASRFACTIGRRVIPGRSSGTSSAEMPRCDGASGSVRTSSMQWLAQSPIDVQTLVPLTTKSSPSSSARQRSPARSLPASGSLKPWHHTSSALRMRPRCACCSGVPAAAMVGPTLLVPNTATRRGALARRNSLSQSIWSSTLSPRPPISTGHAGALHPCAPSSRWNSTRPSHSSASPQRSRWRGTISASTARSSSFGRIGEESSQPASRAGR